MWLLGRLAPDHKTIADFRKNNGLALRKVVLVSSNAPLGGAAEAPHVQVRPGALSHAKAQSNPLLPKVHSA
jgi:hypothetical protein